MTAEFKPTCPQSTEELDEVLTFPPGGALTAVGACPGDTLVLGAAGKMGFHVTRMLQRCQEQLGRTDRVIAVSRFTTDRSRAPFEKFNVETIQADLSDPEQLDALPSVANVFFLAGVKFGTSHDVELLYRMNGEMPRQVARGFATLVSLLFRPVASIRSHRRIPEDRPSKVKPIRRATMHGRAWPASKRLSTDPTSTAHVVRWCD